MPADTLSEHDTGFNAGVELAIRMLKDSESLVTPQLRTRAEKEAAFRVMNLTEGKLRRSLIQLPPTQRRIF